MDDTISRQAAIDLLKKWSDGYRYIETETELAIKEFQELPSAQSERKTGTWVKEIPNYRKCSECGEILGNIYANVANFCPNCGADMRGEQ